MPTAPRIKYDVQGFTVEREYNPAYLAYNVTVSRRGRFYGAMIDEDAYAPVLENKAVVDGIATLLRYCPTYQKTIEIQHFTSCVER